MNLKHSKQNPVISGVPAAVYGVC